MAERIHDLARIGHAELLTPEEAVAQIKDQLQPLLN